MVDVTYTGHVTYAADVNTYKDVTYAGDVMKLRLRFFPKGSTWSKILYLKPQLFSIQ